MPTAYEKAAEERDLWFDLAGRWGSEDFPDLWEDRPPTERAVVVFFDPMPDLARRASEWGHELPAGDLASISSFASGLAELEARSWSASELDVATRAYEARRFLMGDRLIHWAVPWLDAVGTWYPDYRDLARRDGETLLRLADTMRPAPRLSGVEGLHVAGEDSFGPMEPVPGDVWMTSLWSGALVLEKTGGIDDWAAFLESAAAHWSELADRHPGSGRLWSDLGARALRTISTL